MTESADSHTDGFWAGSGDDASSERYRALLNAVGDGVYRLDAEGRIVGVNDALVTLTGGSREALHGEHVSTLLSGADRERIERGLAESGAVTIDAGVATADGSAVPCEVRITPTGDGEVGVVRELPATQGEPGRDTRAPPASIADVIDEADIAVFVLDETFEVAWADETVGDYFGVDPATLIGRDKREVVADTIQDCIDESEAFVERVLATYDDNTAVEQFECRITPTENREERWVEHYSKPIESGEYAGGRIEIYYDVTDRKERERYLEDVKSRLEAATEAGAVGTWEWRIQEDEMIVGESFAEKFGIDPEAARGRVSLERFIESIHEDDRERVAAAIERAVENCAEYEAEYRVENADGEFRWVVARGHVECVDGEAVRFPGTLTDITERKRAELELQRNNDQLEALFEVLPVGVVVADGDGAIVSATDTAGEILGVDVSGSNAFEADREYTVYWADSGERVEPAEGPLGRVTEGTPVTEPEVFEIDAADDQRRIVETEGRPIRDEDGEVTRTVVTLSETTERRRYERKLEESNERLEQFASVASHDLQEPLRMVSSYLQLIEDRYGDALDEEGREFLEFAVDGAERMKSMIDGLLAYSRVETRGEPMAPTDLNAVLEDVRTDLQLRIDETHATVSAEDLPTVEGDEEQLRQLFQNLIENAVEYSGDAPPEVHVGAERRGDRWRIDVADDGIGIDPEDQDRAFEVFQRLHSREEHDGTGIGLALCKRIVERHGGDIWVDSEPGEGSTFRFTLPRVD